MTTTSYPNADPQAVEQLIADICKIAVWDLRQGPQFRGYGTARRFLEQIGMLERVEQQLKETKSCRLLSK